MKTRTRYVDFFKRSFIKWAGAGIFELHEGTIYSLVKLEFLSLSSRIDQAFEEEKTN